MEDLIKTFHIDWRLLIAQTVNFLIVLLALAFFALKPLIKLMQEREKKIAQSLKDAETIDKKVKDIEKERVQEINKGRSEAQKIITQAEKDLELLRAEKKEKIKDELKKLLSAAKAQAMDERRKILKQTKEELGEILDIALRKITADTIDEKTHKRLLDKSLEELEETK